MVKLNSPLKTLRQERGFTQRELGDELMVRAEYISLYENGYTVSPDADKLIRGCMGQPVDAKPCSKCNADGKKEPSLEAQRSWPYFFLTENEWNRHQAENEVKPA